MELTIGENYWTVFGDAAAPGQTPNQMIYLGGIKFRAVNGRTGQIREMDSQDTYNKVKAYISTPNIKMGHM